MGVTKKKAYLKPEMTKFEMKMESIMQSASKPAADTPILIPEVCVTISNNQWLSGGAWSDVSGEDCAVGYLKNLEQHLKEVIPYGFSNGDFVKVEESTSCTTDGNKYAIIVTYHPSTGCSGQEITYSGNNVYIDGELQKQH